MGIEEELPDTVDVEIVRRWVCENCGDWGWRGDDCRCGSESWEKTNGRHFQVTITK